MIVYAQHPSQDKPEQSDVTETPAQIELQLPLAHGKPRWFNPREGEWIQPGREDLTSRVGSTLIHFPFRWRCNPAAAVAK